MITRDPDYPPSSSFNRGHAARWTAPEILKEHGTYSKRADIFSFAMVIIEVRNGLPIVCRVPVHYHLAPLQIFTGMAPFNYSRSSAVMSAITAGGRPPRPTHSAFTDELWMLTQRCWAQEPQSRPEVSEALRDLHGSWVSSF